jgi:hypothetical protein
MSPFRHVRGGQKVSDRKHRDAGRAWRPCSSELSLFAVEHRPSDLSFKIYGQPGEKAKKVPTRTGVLPARHRLILINPFNRTFSKLDFAVACSQAPNPFSVLAINRSLRVGDAHTCDEESGDPRHMSTRPTTFGPSRHFGIVYLYPRLLREPTLASLHKPRSRLRK